MSATSHAAIHPPDHPARHLPASLSATIVFAALYLPQSWLFWIDYPWNSYRLHWISEFLPGLPMFLPFAYFFPNEKLFIIVGSWIATAALALSLYWVGRYSRKGFWIASGLACGWSAFNAMMGYAFFQF